MFLGTYHHTMDGKGRITIPADFRQRLGEEFVLTKGLDDCLFVYPLSEWHKLESKLKELPFTNSDARTFVRFFFAGAKRCTLDSQGRVLIPGHLREYAHLDRETIVIGVSNRVEIWSEESWDDYESTAEESYEDIAETIEELRI